MTKRVPLRVLNLARSAVMVVSAICGSVGVAAAQAPVATPVPVPVPVPAPVPAQPMSTPEAMPLHGQTPLEAVAPTMGGVGTTDHDNVVGLWGIEARTIGTFQRTLGQEAGCADSCPVDLNALSLRKWTTSKYAWSAGLALALGGGSGRDATATSKTWDTYFGIGPTVGASFLLASWQHLAVSLAPALDAVYFIPSGKGSKSLLINLRGLVEGEVHLGMIGLPTASVGIASGLQASYLYAGKDTKPGAVNTGLTASKWSLSVNGPTALWDLVTKAYIRYYF